ncbi:Dynamitin-domain-containing protein [Crepidotus variabilis]|uniref:Dynamitin-domain-containing protein n=1 Tax=Crepidotus variabilis TaxID=179855 RepID=A0A9P6EHX6_9AGAR|nr:Dynamitin-domain-containing protein [Crepidotus variabilis]
MSGSKYADLPDIDTAPDVYETDDIFPSSEAANAESSDDEALPSRSTRPKADPSTREELDASNLIGTEEASKKFERAEKRRLRQRSHYAYPPSPTSQSPSLEHGQDSRPVPLSHRLRALQSELSALEVELADPSNPLLQREREEDNVDPGELFRGLVDVRSRLDKIKKGKEGRARLVNVVLDSDTPSNGSANTKIVTTASKAEPDAPKSEMQTMVQVDHRVGELETIIGSSTATLDETSPLPAPLLPLITRLNNQLTILTQPRHIDSISRRLKILLSDLDRASAAQHQGHKRQVSQGNGPSPPNLQEQLLPLLSRLGPLIPHIPHILTRLRTLSALHSSATAFQTNLEDLEEGQRKTHATLLELESAVKTVEKSLDENREVVKNNVAGLEARVNLLLERLDDLHHQDSTE